MTVMRRSKFGILGARANRAKTPRSRSQDVQSVPAGGDSQDSLKMMLQSKSTKCTDDDVEETSANMIQVRHKVTHLKTPIERKGKDEKKKRGECKAESQPKLVRRLRSSCQCTKSEEKLSFFSIQPTIGSLFTNEGVKSFQTIAGVTTYSPNTIHYIYRDGKIEN